MDGIKISQEHYITSTGSYKVEPICGSRVRLCICADISSVMMLFLPFPLDVPLVSLGITALAVLAVDFRRDAESALLSTVGGFGNRRRSQGWRNACPGVIRVDGSQSKHRFIKSRKSGSSHPFRAVTISLLLGGPLGFPRLERQPFSTVLPSGRVVTVQYLG